ncbi:glycosyltransferase family 4 protein [Desertivirga xinjiangensis]|uniref:glycosyltransferase family 4 protein n=1 Tax=Desertivirga xinjiangensis TaxID=539206 RepID=UPI00210A603B|nr:glycosyltransferase family 4 protein [Pedobacter xinjiangensis]
MQRKIRVVEAVNQLGLGGTEYALQLFAKYFDKDIFSVCVVAIHKGGERVQLIKDLGIVVEILHDDLNRFAEILEETDVLHWHGSGDMDERLFEVIKGNKPRLVIQTNVFGGYDHSPLYEVIDYDLYVSKMTLVRRMQVDGSLGLIFANKRKILPNPIDTEYIQGLIPDDSEVEKFKAQYGLIEKFVVGRVGRADDNKFDLITLDAFAHFLKRNFKSKFLLVGATEKMLNHAAALDILDSLVILETTSDLRQLLTYYKAMDTFLAISNIGESFGMVIAEAMLVGVPVLTVSTPDKDNAQIELVDNGISGLVVSRSVSSISDGLKFLYSNPRYRSRLAVKARAKVLNNYSASDIVKSLELLILDKFLDKNALNAESKAIAWHKSLTAEYQNRCRNLFKASNVLDRTINLFKSDSFI